jgi:CubicO group peptidase (beta-lactamase class C family)
MAATLEPTVDPGDVGLDAARLGRLDRLFTGYVDRGQLAGWQVALARGGHLAHVASAGHRDREQGAPVTGDPGTGETVWRIYSMTKPITSVLALMLWEEGLFELKDPVARFLPEFAEQRVWRSGTATAPSLEPVTEPMLLWHLLTHTSGLTYGFMHAHPVDAMYRAAGFDTATPRTDDLAAQCAALARLPLVFQPGSEWNYSMSIDVLGRVIEVVTGQTLDEAMRTRVLEPLGMHDTGFQVPADQAHRLATIYTAPTGSGGTDRDSLVALGGVTRSVLAPPTALLGGGGLVSTTADYLRFAEMLRGRGHLDGTRLLSPRTVDFATRNHLPGGVDLTEFGRPLFSETTYDGVGFGLLGSVTIDPVKAKVPASVGDFGWGGAASTFFWVDPVEDLVCVFMTQLLPSGSLPLRSQLKQMVHQALIG